MIQVTNGGAELVVVRGGVTSYYTYSSFKSIAWFQANNGNYIVVITFLTDPAGSVPLKISLNEVDNQPAWTNDVLGSEEAIKTISGWISAAIAPATGLATEATLLDVLSAVDSMRDYEVRLVVDASDVTWLEVRYWDAQDGALGAPQYYLPGSTTAGSPVLPISYINDRTLLTQILAALQGTLTVAGTVALDAPTLTALENITVQNGSGAAAVNIQDGGNAITVDDGGGSITVDGTITTVPSGTQNVSITSSIALPVTDNGGSITVDGTVALDSASLTALENITVQNGAGAAAVNIQDGGNSITVDGSVSVSNFPSSVEISNDSGNPIPVSGTVTITDGSGPVTVDGTVAATQSGTWNINNITGTVSLPTGAATETTLAAVNTKLTATTRTHNTLSATGAGSVPSGSLRGSVLNAGSAVGTWNGISLPAGVAIPWDAVGPRDTYGVIAYNATGTTFIIEYTT